MTQSNPKRPDKLSGSAIGQIFGIIIVSSIAISTVGHFVLEAPFVGLLLVLLGLESFLAVLFIVYRAFVSNLS
jgi:hypothetical protein